MILDSTCSQKKIWPVYADIRIDIKAEAKPDIVADARHLPFRTEIFDEIYCDPPHLIRKDQHNWIARRAAYLLRFGAWKSREEWVLFLCRIDQEFYKALKPTGILWFKITDGKDKRVTRLSDLDFLKKFIMMFDESKPSRAVWSKNTTHYVKLLPDKLSEPAATLTAESVLTAWSRTVGVPAQETRYGV